MPEKTEGNEISHYLSEEITRGILEGLKEGTSRGIKNGFKKALEDSLDNGFLKLRQNWYPSYLDKRKVASSIKDNFDLMVKPALKEDLEKMFSNINAEEPETHLKIKEEIESEIREVRTKLNPAADSIFEGVVDAVLEGIKECLEEVYEKYEKRCRNWKTNSTNG